MINEPKPYLHHDVYRTRYVHYREYYDHQTALRDHRDKHERDENDGPGNGHGNGHAYGHDKDHKGKDRDDH